MKIDRHTLRDLEVFESIEPGGTTLFAIVNRTRTAIGRRRLRRIAAEPFHEATRIAEMQRAQQLIAENLHHYRAHLDEARIDDVDSYLGSRWEPARFRSKAFRVLESYWLRMRHPDIVRVAMAGANLVSTLLRSANRIQDALRPNGNHLLERLADNLNSLLAQPALVELQNLIDRGSSVASLLAVDQLARGRARDSLAELVEEFGGVEAIWSLAAATKEHGWTYPEVSGTECRIKGLYHPFLGRSSVRNDLTIGPATRVLFITGPNMAGKSTFAKACALALLLAHLGCGTPAESMSFLPLHALFTTGQVSENLSAGESFYLAEVRRVRLLAEELRSHGRMLAVMDEPFRGTNLHDAAEATLAIIGRLAAHPSALVLMTSHLAEIAPALEANPGVSLVKFVAEIIDGQPRFDYRVRPGSSDQRLGMTLLRQEGVLKLMEAW